MSRLTENINSRYFEAAGKFAGQGKPVRIVAYVESYDDILFWRSVLRPFEDATRYFEVMLPYSGRLSRGKKSAITKVLREGSGPRMLACVDADYDWLMQGRTESSLRMLSSKYVLHTYAYSIENLQCWAPSLHDVCVMVTLNDRRMFDFERFLMEYSRAVWPLLVASVWYYRKELHGDFPLQEMNETVGLPRVRIHGAGGAIRSLRNKVEAKLLQVKQRHPECEAELPTLEEELSGMGLTPDTAYLYIQGHNLFDKVVAPLVAGVCSALIVDRENEIRRQSVHRVQMTNELNCYTHSVQNVSQMLKKNFGYTQSDVYHRICCDVRRILENEQC